MASKAVAERSEDKDSSAKSSKKTGSRGNIFSWLSRFVREVVAELRKVVWPTRKQLITYTTVVVVFLAIMTAIISTLDYGLGKAVLWIFGSNSAS